MQLSLRLSAIADLVTEGNRLVDVGCDHGYLPVYLIQQKKIPSALQWMCEKGHFPGHRNISGSMDWRNTYRPGSQTDLKLESRRG